MTSLVNQLPEYTFPDILTTTNSGQGLTNVLKNIQDGIGNNSTVQIANNAINFNRTGGNTFQLDGIAITPSGTNINAVCNPNAVMPGNGSMTIPIGTTAQRPVTPFNGMFRYNTNLNAFEFYQNGAWVTDAGAILSVTGTPNQITVTVGQNPTIALATNITGVNSITLGNLELNVSANVIASSSGDISISSSGDIDLQSGGSVKISIGSDLKFYNLAGTLYTGLVAPTTPTNTIFKLPASDGVPQTYLGTDGSQNLSFYYPTLFYLSITQTAHGFSPGQILMRSSVSAFSLAQADNAADAQVVGIVSAVINANVFYMQFGGYISAGPVSGLTGGTVYFLSPTTAGAYTSTQPSTPGQVIKPLFIAYNATSAFWINQLGQVI